MSHMNMHMSKEHLMVFQVNRNIQKVNNRNIHASLKCDDLSQPPQYLKCSSPNKSLIFVGHTVLVTVFFCVGGYYKHGYKLRKYLYYYRLILWNPNTRDAKLVHLESCKSSYEFQGFGVDPNSSDFKIIKPTINIDDLHHPIISFAEIYNLSTNSRTHDVTLPPINNFLEQPGCRSYVLVNGVYHWLIGYEDGFGYILCFDFHKNQFSKLMAPVDLSNRESLLAKDNIVEVNGSIGIVQYRTQERLEFWVMNEHKWTKTHSIVWPGKIIIFGVWKDANQLLGGKDDQGKQRLTIYNLDAQPMHQFQVEVFDFPRIDKYVESIVPLSA